MALTAASSWVVGTDCMPTHTVFFQVHGPELFVALPAGGLARMLLPLRVRYENRDGCLELVLGAKRLSRATLLSGLNSIVEAGDAPFVFELRCTPPSPS